MFLLDGEGVRRDKNSEKPVKQGDVFFIPPMEWHQFANTGKETMKFLCLIPYKS